MPRQPLFEKAPPIILLISFLSIALVCLSIFGVIASGILSFGFDVSLQDINSRMSNGTLQNHELIAAKISQLLSATGLFIVPSLIMPYLFTRTGIGFLGLRNSPTKIMAGLTAVVMIAAIPLINYTAYLNGLFSLPESMADLEQLLRDFEKQGEVTTMAFLSFHSTTDIILSFFAVAVIPAIGEELMFRGMIQRLIGKMSKNPHVAIWMTAILFSAVHMQFFGFIPRMLLGALLGYLYYWSKSIWLPILAHFINNALSLLFAFLIKRDLLAEGSDELGSSGEYLFIIASLLVVTWATIQLRKRKVIASADDAAELSPGDTSSSS